MDIDRIYYINLDTRKNRKDHIEQQFTMAGIPFSKITRFSAIDGETYHFSAEEKLMFLSANIYRNLGSKITEKIMGNQLSHYYIWKDMLEKKYKKILILQDDVVFCPNFIFHFNLVSQSIPLNAEIINLGFHKKAHNSYFQSFHFTTSENDSEFLQKEEVNTHICKLKDTVNCCSLAYILTDHGANLIYSNFTNQGFKAECEHNLNNYLKKKDIFYGSRKVLCTGNSQLPSDVFPPASIITHPLMNIVYFLILLFFINIFSE